MYPMSGYVILRAYQGSGAGWIKRTGEKWELRVKALLPNQKFHVYVHVLDAVARCADIQTDSAGEGFCIISDIKESPAVLLANETLENVLSTPCEDIGTFLWLAKKDIQAEKQPVPTKETLMHKQYPELPPNKDDRLVTPQRQEDEASKDVIQKADDSPQVPTERPAAALPQAEKRHLDNPEAPSNEQQQADINIANKTNDTDHIVRNAVRYKPRILHAQKHARSKKPYVLFRPESDGKPLDALPSLLWPDAAREFRYYFENHLPNAVLSGQDWRYVELHRNKESPRILGRHIKNERVDRVMIARAADHTHSDASNDDSVLSGRDGRVYIARFYDV